MKQLWLMAVMTAFLVLPVAARPVSGEQPPEPVALTVRLRTASGSPLAGEPVMLQRLPGEETVLPACTTGSQGECIWYVGRGLYQVLFERPLDDVSALALAEGGLRGFGLTVGESAITYHFTLQGDGRIYFDVAPQAPVPVPIIPTLALLHGGVAPTPSPTPDESTPAGTPPSSGSSKDGEPIADDTPLPSTDVQAVEEGVIGWPWHLLLLVGLGLALGGSLHLWSRRTRHSAPGLRRPPGGTDEGQHHA